jgi:hypothetical protein
LYIDTDWDRNNREYILQYEIQAKEGNLKNIGCHNSYFNNGFSIEVKNSSGTVVSKQQGTNAIPINGTSFESNTRYIVTIRCISHNNGGI